MKEWIVKIRAAFLDLKDILILRQLSAKTKVRIFNTNVDTVLSYGAKTWRTTTAIIDEV